MYLDENLLQKCHNRPACLPVLKLATTLLEAFVNCEPMPGKLAFVQILKVHGGDLVKHIAKRITDYENSHVKLEAHKQEDYDLCSDVIKMLDQIFLNKKDLQDWLYDFTKSKPDVTNKQIAMYFYDCFVETAPSDQLKGILRMIMVKFHELIIAHIIVAIEDFEHYGEWNGVEGLKNDEL